MQNYGTLKVFNKQKEPVLVPTCMIDDLPKTNFKSGNAIVMIVMILYVTHSKPQRQRNQPRLCQ